MKIAGTRTNDGTDADVVADQRSGSLPGVGCPSRREFLARLTALGASALLPGYQSLAGDHQVARTIVWNLEGVMMKRIAIEEAFVTPEISEEWKKVLGSKNVEPGFREMGKTIHGNPGTQMVHARLLDIGAGRIAHLDATGIDMQVLSLTAPGVQVFDAITGAALARQSND